MRHIYVFLLWILIKIPVVKDIVLIVNAYAWRGDILFVDRIAPPTHWLSRFGFRLSLSAIVTFLFYGQSFAQWICGYIPWFSSVVDKIITPIPHCEIGYELTLSIFPNLLGFGLGVYALIFSLPGAMNNQKIKTNLLNADMGYPLLMMVLAIILAVFAKIFDGQHHLAGASFFAFLYCLLLLLELISLIFMSAASVINGKP